MTFNVPVNCSLNLFLIKAVTFACVLFPVLQYNSANAQPPDFTLSTVSNNWSEAEGFTFDANGTMYVWEKGGRVWIVDTNGTKLPQPLIDINDEVGNWRDHGLNGFALDPDFLNNGYIYLDYTVDRHHLLFYGTPNYNPNTNTYYAATIERLTRYTADTATNFTSVIPASRFILIGEDIKSGIPVLHESHSGSSLVFGTDGTLLMSTGDGASYNFADGGNGGTYWSQALADSIILPKENVGAFRSQMVDCLNGKILRVDPSTGNGLETNPFYDSLNPRAAKSRVWALGFRNPFRMCLRPGTGNTDPTAGDPGVLYMGDVGWDLWEDINVIKGAGGNYGWPLYEGLTPQLSYQSLTVYNRDAPNPLYGTGGCMQQYFTFKQLLKQATLDSAASFRNPCDTSQLIPSDIHTFFHTRPGIDYKHGFQARTGIFNGLNAAEIDIDSSQSPVTGPRFGGYASVGGCWYNDIRFPLQYQNTYFHGDYAVGFIRNFSYDENNNPLEERQFWDGVGANVFMGVNPRTGCLTYVSYPNEIKSICYTGIINNPPKAIAEADTIYGVSPLTVNFTGSNSTDPENGLLTYSWDFGDGQTSLQADPSNVYTAPAGVPTTYTAMLTVTDDASQTSTDSLKIFINNTPPVVQIISFNEGDLYSMSHNTTLPLEASVTDAEHGPAELFYNWKVFLHHNSHEHPEEPDTNRITSAIITPSGCNGQTYFYRVELTVMDAGGLSTTVQASVYPACDPPVADFISNVTSVCPGGTIDFTDVSSNLPDSIWWYFPGGTPILATGSNPSVTYNTPGNYDVQIIAGSVRGVDTLLMPGYITVFNPPVVNLGNDTSICEGTSHVLEAGFDGITYLWNDSTTDHQLIVDSTGLYYVNVTGIGGCVSADSINVNVILLPIVTFDPFSDDSVCASDSPFILIGGSPSGGIYSGSGVTGNQFDPSAAVLGTNTITYIYADLSGCTDSASQNILVDLCLGIQAVNEINSFIISPNPTRSQIDVTVETIKETTFKIRILDINNRVMVDENFLISRMLKKTFDLSRCSPGIYLLQLIDDKQSIIRKIIKE